MSDPSVVSAEPASPPGRTVRQLLAAAPAALVVGIGCSLLLLVVSWIAGRWQHVLWEVLPRWWGFDGSRWWWILLMLTLTGVAVGLVVAFVPGHGGPDPATEALVGPPMPAYAVPGLLLAAALALAGGVSLGPENPITAANIALACAAGVKLRGRASVPGWVGLAAAGTIGALFGTPVAAALVLSESAGGDPRVPLWDRLFAPLVAAGAGALTTQAVASPVFAVDVPVYPGFHFADLLSAAGCALAGGLAGLAVIYPFPFVHKLFHRLRHPVVMLAAGGAVLGLLGAVGGLITMFKGLDEMKELTSGVAGYTTGGLVLILAVKACALLVAASCGFRGGRIFPAVFIGVALGLLAARLIPAIPVGLAIACAILGVTLAVTQQGWLSLFMAATVVLDMRLLPLLCFAILPVWLLLHGRPQMLITEPAKGSMAIS